jgi:Histidine kinase-like ATPase domain
MRKGLKVRGPGAGTPVRYSRNFPGRADQVAQVRAFIAELLDGCPVAADVMLIADELAANAVQHSRSGAYGGQFTVDVEVCDGRWVWAGVEDLGGPTAPRLRDCADDGADGRGLRIVAALAAAWGVAGGATGRKVWFLIGWGHSDQLCPRGEG